MSARAMAWDRLVQAGLATGAVPPAGEDATPWYVTAMTGTAAWIAALCMLGFVGAALSVVVRSGGSALVVGAVLCAASVAVLRVRGAGLFLRQVAVPFSLAGQALVVFGLTDHHLREPLAWAGIAVFEAALVAAAAETVHRTLAALACLVALRIALMTAGVPWLVAPLLLAGMLALFVAADRRPAQEALWSPLWAAVGLLVLGLLPLTLADAIFWYGTRSAPPPALVHAGAVLVGVAWLGVVAVLAATSNVVMRARTKALVAAGALVVAGCAWGIPMVVVSLALLLLAFAAGRRVLAGVAVLALLGALAHAYYALQWTLLAKAGALAVTGAVLLAASVIARYAREPEADDA